jgi:26S proteasome regulatory subunit N2
MVFILAGVGLAAMGTHDKAVYYKLRDVLNADDAIASEAAALAMGLVFIGVSGEAFNEPYTEMIQVGFFSHLPR